MKPEARISKDIRDFLRTLGFAVYSLEQGYRPERGGTRQTPGLPDLYAMGKGFGMWIEVKTPKGKLRASQELFRDEARANGVNWHCWRSVSDAVEWAKELGILEAA